MALISESERAAGDSMPGAAAPPQQVLFVEDQVRHRHIYEQAVREATGALITFATSVGEAWEKLQTGPAPDLVLVDLDLPDRGGGDLLKLIRSLPRLQALPVVILTGHADAPTQMALLENGADDFIEKGGPPSVLMARLRAQMRHKFAVDRLERLALDRDLFAAGVLAEIGASKGLIVAQCQAALAALAAPKPMAEVTEIISTIVEKLAANASRLGAYATDVIQTVRDGQRQPIFAVMAIRDAVDWAKELLSDGQVGSAIEVTCEAPGLTLRADQVLLRLALLSILRHAQSRGAKHATISQQAAASAQAPRVLTCITDDGPTPTPEELRRLFNSSRYGSSSIGLAIVTRAVDRMGGEVQVQASERGGLRVCLLLPTP